MSEVRCRAQLVDDCRHGTPDDPNEPFEDDGTFDGSTVVCTPCYCAVMPFTPSGQALRDELPHAIGVYRGSVEFVRDHADPAALAADAETVAAIARTGSPRHASALASAALARAEVARREREASA